jgi:RNA polymerase sigma-70 factor, ECF subfamily
VTRRAEAHRQGRFEQLYRETRRDLLAYALRRTRSAEDAADVLAETYLIAWRKLDSLPRGEDARLWLFGVARNVLRRGATRQHALSAMVERLAQELREQEATEPASQNALAPRIQAALQALPETQREVLLFTAWEGLTPREIAVATRTPVNLVRVRLHRARTHVRRALSERPGSEASRNHNSERQPPRVLDTS